MRYGTSAGPMAATSTSRFAGRLAKWTAHAPPRWNWQNYLRMSFSPPAQPPLQRSSRRRNPFRWFFVIVNDPVAQGFVASVAHPGSNITGFSYMDYSVLEKALQLLQQTSPRLDRVGFMFNPDTYPYYEVYLQKLGGKQFGFDLKPLRVRSEVEITDAFRDLTAAGTGLIVPPEPFTSAHRKQIVALAAQYRLPATYGLRDFVTDGGLMSYAPDISDIFSRSASYIDRILKGALPGELPVQAPTKTVFVINLKTAKALGIAIPPTLLALADEVIE
jgi:putative tryptophan/tyrosine transport system substrate-binding protein